MYTHITDFQTNLVQFDIYQNDKWHPITSFVKRHDTYRILIKIHEYIGKRIRINLLSHFDI